MDPTPEMISFFERRTREHIEHVRHCLSLLAAESEFAEELGARAESHDASKFSDAERIPYIWLTEFHRCRQNEIEFQYPEGMEEKVRQAIVHHVTSNRHHVEFHSDPNQMTDVDVIEMVCDWTAMSIEFGQDNGSAIGWAKKTVGRRIKFDKLRTDLIFQSIQRLDELRELT